MSGLLYREDMDEVRKRMTIWWDGGDIGRPAMFASLSGLASLNRQITAPRPKPLEEIEAMPEPEGWVTHYSTSNFDYRVNLSAQQCINII